MIDTQYKKTEEKQEATSLQKDVGSTNDAAKIASDTAKAEHKDAA
ncbi:MAG: hypothetical protein Q7T54_04495 [Candidatus Levybacteria bacterium]|nr:hypothetical protein [Candidatus Levybacteria bacterium]